MRTPEPSLRRVALRLPWRCCWAVLLPLWMAAPAAAQDAADDADSLSGYIVDPSATTRRARRPAPEDTAGTADSALLGRPRSIERITPSERLAVQRQLANPRQGAGRLFGGRLTYRDSTTALYYASGGRDRDPSELSYQQTPPPATLAGYWVRLAVANDTKATTAAYILLFSAPNLTVDRVAFAQAYTGTKNAHLPVLQNQVAYRFDVGQAAKGIVYLHVYDAPVQAWLFQEQDYIPWQTDAYGVPSTGVRIGVGIAIGFCVLIVLQYLLFSKRASHLFIGIAILLAGIHVYLTNPLDEVVLARLQAHELRLLGETFAAFALASFAWFLAGSVREYRTVFRLFGWVAVLVGVYFAVQTFYPLHFAGLRSTVLNLLGFVFAATGAGLVVAKMRGVANAWSVTYQLLVFVLGLVSVYCLLGLVWQTSGASFEFVKPEAATNVTWIIFGLAGCICAVAVIHDTFWGAVDNYLAHFLPVHLRRDIIRRGGQPSAKPAQRNDISVLFSDIKGFSVASRELKVLDLVDQLGTYFNAFDEICRRYGVERIKTIGDSYMAAAGFTDQQANPHALLVLAGLDMQRSVAALAKQARGTSETWRLRVGINTGAVAEHIMGDFRWNYDLWGDTVNTAKDTETKSAVGAVTITEFTKSKVDAYFVCEPLPEPLVMKSGKELQLYRVLGIRAELSERADGQEPNEQFWALQRSGA